MSCPFSSCVLPLPPLFFHTLTHITLHYITDIPHCLLSHILSPPSHPPLIPFTSSSLPSLQPSPSLLLSTSSSSENGAIQYITTFHNTRKSTYNYQYNSSSILARNSNSSAIFRKFCTLSTVLITTQWMTEHDKASPLICRKQTCPAHHPQQCPMHAEYINPAHPLQQRSSSSHLAPMSSSMHHLSTARAHSKPRHILMS